MRYLLLILAFFAACPCSAWDNPDPRNVPPERVSPDRKSTLDLEARRVKSIHGNTITYDLGHSRDITIRANTFASERFIKDVERGRAAAHQKVALEPVRKSPFNRDFKAVK